MKHRNTAEERLAARIAESGLIRFGDGRLSPTAASDDDERRVRGAYLRHLILQTDDTADPGGIELEGAVIEGGIDLNGLKLSRRMYFGNCRFEGLISCHDANLSTLRLVGCEFDGFLAHRTTINGEIQIGEAAVAHGSIEIVSSTIKGDLKLYCSSLCSDTSKDNPTFALDLSNSTIKGSFYLNQTVNARRQTHVLEAEVPGPGSPKAVVAENGQGPDIKEKFIDPSPIVPGCLGPVRAHGLTVARSLEISAAKISGEIQPGEFDRRLNDPDWDNRIQTGLNLEAAEVGDLLMIGGGTVVHGGLRLFGAKFGGIEIEQSKFHPQMICDGEDDTGETKNISYLPALDLYLCRVSGRMRLDSDIECDGPVRFDLAHARTIDLSPAGWSAKTYSLDGLTYERFDRSTSRIATEVMSWLNGQDTGATAGFSPQPWTQASTVLQAMGLEDDAKNVRIETARHSAKDEIKRFKRALWSAFENPVHVPSACAAPFGLVAIICIWLFHRAYDLVIQFGHNPLRAGWWMLGCIFIGWLVLETNSGLIVSASDKTGPPKDMAMLAIDIFLPVLKLGWDGFWEPMDGSRLWYFVAGYRALGWIIAGFAVAGFTGLAKK